MNFRKVYIYEWEERCHGVERKPIAILENVVQIIERIDYNIGDTWHAFSFVYVKDGKMVTSREYYGDFYYYYDESY